MTAGITQANLFDYAALDTETRVVVQQRTTELREDDRAFNDLMRQSVERAWRIGNKLTDVQNRLRGRFLDWLKAEFPHWAQRSAYRFIDVYKRFEFANLANVQIGLSAAYLLAAPSTPEDARTEALERAEAGEPITYSKARQIVNEYKDFNAILEDANDAVIEGRSPMSPPEDGATIYRQCPYCNTSYYTAVADVTECPTCHQLHAYSGPRDTATYGAHITITPDPPEDIPDYSGDEWYTPREYIAAAREVLGSITLDPASCLAAQAIVKADRIYTVETDGLAQPWSGRIWLNPPYSMPLIQKFVKRLIDHYEAGDVTAAIILTNNCTDAGWFHSLLEAYPVCFTRGRIPFWRPNQASFATRQGQAFFYLGNEVQRFANAFSQFGIVVTRLP